jgi:glycosyltransferase involved in cell wall biosynthesis
MVPRVNVPDRLPELRGHRILYIAYPLLTVSRESAGGAEQVLWTLEREMARFGPQTTVAASNGSCVAGELFSTGEPSRRPDDLERRTREHQERILAFVESRAREGRPFDLVHDHSGGFWPRAAEISSPVLATLHLPRSFYPPHCFDSIPANVSFNCVSASQDRGFASIDAVRTVVHNGIALDLLETVDRVVDGPRCGLLWLGRICVEKAPHLALDIAAQAGLPITIAGHVYPFSYHQQYFDREVAPRLRRMPQATFISLPPFDAKRRLLRSAQAVLITSIVEETSSLVAMEAAASGTPVVAFARGALPEIVRDGVTGVVVNSAEAAVQALRYIDEIDPAICADHARACFDSAKMAESYAQLYAKVSTRRSPACEPSRRSDGGTVRVLDSSLTR